MSSPTRLFVSIAHAGLKAAKAKLRGVGATATSEHWTTRAAVCERCHLKVVKCGVSYCGKPFLQLPVRNEAVDGCGCPTRAKAKDPAEHCPLTPRHRPTTPATAVTANDPAAPACDCKWCAAVSQIPTAA